MHARAASPSTWTVQAPHKAIPQPNFVPVSPNSSRRYQSSGIDGSPSNDCSWPLTRNLTMACLPEWCRSWDSISEEPVNVYSGHHDGGAGASGRMLDYAWLARRSPVRSHVQSHWSDRRDESTVIEQAAICTIGLAPRLTISVCRGQRSPPQCEGAQHVVGER